MVKKRYMLKMNWILVISGMFATFLGYFFVSSITRDYETPKAFFSILTLNLGLLTVLLGLSISFDKRELSLNKQEN